MTVTRHRGDAIAMFLSWALLAVAFHPINAWPLAWLAPLPWMIRHMDPRLDGDPRSGRWWMLFEYLIVASTLAWLRTLAPPLIFLIPLLGMPTAWLTGWWLDRGRAHGVPPWFLYPTVITCCAVLRDTILGLSWASWGYTQVEIAPLLRLAAIGRVHLVSWLMLSLAAAVAFAWVHRSNDGLRARAQRGLIISLGCIAIGLGIGWLWQPTVDPDGPLTVVVQPNVPQAERLREGPGRQAVVQAGILERFLEPVPDLAVLPETCFPAVREPSDRTLEYILDRPASFSSTGETLFRFRDSVLRSPGQVTILGVTVGQAIAPNDAAAHQRDEDKDGYLTQNVAWVLNGGIPTPRDVRYGKRILCPFGEYVPWPSNGPGKSTLTRWIADVGGYIPDLEPGTSSGMFSVRSPKGNRTGSLSICFEAVFPGFFREGVREGADFLVNISNDAWFFDSEELDLVDVATRFRAVECSRSVVRVSNSGISTIFAPDGKRLAVVEDRDGKRKEVAGGFSQRVPISREITPFVRLGDWPWAILGAIAMFVCRRRR